MQNFYLFSIQTGPKVIKITVSQLQFFFGVGKGQTQYTKKVQNFTCWLKNLIYNNFLNAYNSKI